MFVIPMAGKSQRFVDAGYYDPKFMLYAGGRPLFDYAVSSFSSFFSDNEFLFIVRGDESEAFVESRCRTLGIQLFETVVLDKETDGQASTVFIGIETANVADSQPLTVFNIDTYRPGFDLTERIDENSDGFLEVFIAGGENWSFVRPKGNSDVVLETAEKKRISNLCSTGLYHFSRVSDYRFAMMNPPTTNSPAERAERYVAPLYNTLIKSGKTIRYRLVEPGDVVNFGTPEQYNLFSNQCDQGLWRLSS